MSTACGEPADRLARLSTRERQIMDLSMAGVGNREIAMQLGISPRTVEVFKARMLLKMRVKDVQELHGLPLPERPKDDRSG